MARIFATCLILDKKAVLSQGEPRDAAINFDTYRILQRHACCDFSATARLKLHTVRWFWRPWRKNHDDHSNRSGGLHKSWTYSTTVTFRPFMVIHCKVIDFGTNRKRTCDFLLVRHSINIAPFRRYYRFLWSWPQPYSTLILEVFPLDQIAHVGVSPSI